MPAGTVIRWCERCLSMFAIAGVLGCAYLGILGSTRPAGVSSSGWFLIGSAAGLCLLSGLLLVAGSQLDDFARRIVRRPAREASVGDRWMVVIASTCLLAGAVAEASMFSVLTEDVAKTGNAARTGSP